MPADFCHLRVHSHYSLLQASGLIEELVQAAKADEQPALAITDYGNLFGAIEQVRECKKAGIKPLLGMAAYCAGKSRLERTTGAENATWGLTLLAENHRGWQNLCKLATRAHVEGFYYRPRIDREILAEHREGLIVLSGPLTGEVQQKLLAHDYEGARRAAAEMRELVGEANYFLEIQRNESELQKRAADGLQRLASELGIPLVATNDVHYLRQEDWIAQDILLCISNGSVVTDQNRFRMSSRQLWFKTRAEMAQLFADLPDALTNTVAIANRCKVELDLRTYHLPVFVPPFGETPEQLFDRLCRSGLAERYPRSTPELEQRLAYEAGVVKKLGFVSYFLVVWDFIRYARESGIAVGPGRGSAAGSLVAYCLRITDVDPIEYGLIFERFLNPERVSMPDIDVDFCAARREEVIAYVRKKYGEANVSQIVTFGTMASRGVLRDVARTLEIPLAEVDKIAKKVPQGPGASLKKALEDPNSELHALRAASEETRRLFDIGTKLEGLARHTSTHAAGVVIADRPLVDYVPMCRNADLITTQWQMNELEEVGLLKMDFLGLKTLDILEECVRLVEETRGTRLDLDHLPLDDKATYELMTRGETLGVFQLESGGMRELLHDLKPDTFADVIAVLALYRPGPIGSGMVKMFCKRKHGQEPIEYPHASVQPILADTYGVIVYQEQVMLIANTLAGFTLAEADSLRKAMGKKQPEVMAKFKDKFVEGAARNGHDRKFAQQLFETIEYFAGYGFNKSHSTAYALLTYRTAYLKAHHPVEFLAANLTIEAGNSDKVKEFVDEARRMHVAVLPPDVNTSVARFVVEDGAVRFGLFAIKGLGERAAVAIVTERERAGHFASLDALCERLDQTILNKASLEALAKAGAFDPLRITRRQAVATLDHAMRSAAAVRKDRKKGQGSLFATATAAEPVAESGSEWGEKEKLAQEKAVLGFYLSGHPFERRGRFFARLAGWTSAMLRDQRPAEGTEVRIAGMISGIKVLQIKQGRNAGQKMARFQLEDLEGIVQVTCFARQYQEFQRDILEDAIVFVRGRIDGSGEETAILADEIRPASAVIEQEVGSLVLRLPDTALREREIERVAEIAGKHPGAQRLCFEVEQDGAVFGIRADPRFNIRVGDELLDRLSEVVGPGALSFARR